MGEYSNISKTYFLPLTEVDDYNVDFFGDHRNDDDDQLIWKDEYTNTLCPHNAKNMTSHE